MNRRREFGSFINWERLDHDRINREFGEQVDERYRSMFNDDKEMGAKSKKTGHTVEPDFKNRHTNQWTGEVNDVTILDQIMDKVSQAETAWKLHMAKIACEMETVTDAELI